MAHREHLPRLPSSRRFLQRHFKISTLKSKNSKIINQYASSTQGCSRNVPWWRPSSPPRAPLNQILPTGISGSLSRAALALWTGLALTTLSFWIKQERTIRLSKNRMAPTWQVPQIQANKERCRLCQKSKDWSQRKRPKGNRVVTGSEPTSPTARSKF